MIKYLIIFRAYNFKEICHFDSVFFKIAKSDSFRKNSTSYLIF